MTACCQRFSAGMNNTEKQRFAALTTVFNRAPSGNIVELGVASGVSFRMWGHLMAHHRGSGSLYGFDTFAGFPAIGSEDGPEMPAIGKRKGGETELRPRPITWREACGGMHTAQVADDWVWDTWRLVEGAIEQTIEYAPPAVSLVFFDADLYSPTKIGIDVLWPRLVRGGLFVFDEYGREEWPGETRAVDDFVAREGLSLELMDMPMGPSALVVRP